MISFRSDGEENREETQAFMPHVPYCNDRENGVCLV